MDLILWRHAEAEPGDPDDARILTGKGHKQAWKAAEWLDRNLPSSCKILVSPTTRTLQTAEALGRKFKVHPGLAPGASAEDVLAIAHWPDGRDPVLVVGHQPTLGQVAALLLSGTPQDWAVRKGNAWWLAQKERGDRTSVYLKSVMTTDLLGK